MLTFLYITTLNKRGNCIIFFFSKLDQSQQFLFVDLGIPNIEIISIIKLKCQTYLILLLEKLELFYGRKHLRKCPLTRFIVCNYGHGYAMIVKIALTNL
jgi:hypothetical protein